jgi:hypothetical protein
MKTHLHGERGSLKYVKIFDDKGRVVLIDGEILVSIIHKVVGLRELEKVIQYSREDISKMQERKAFSYHKHIYFER